MQTLLPSQFKKGMVLMVEDSPNLIEQFHTSGTAQTKPKLHTRLRNLKTGRITERVFAENEHVPVADLEIRHVQFSYKQGDTYVFLDAHTFDELDLTENQIGERHWFLHENDEYKAYFIEGRLLDIVLPEHVALQVVETGPVQKGGSQTAYKAAKLEGGLEIMVPLFIATGDRVKLDTRDRKYFGKESAG